MKNKLQFLASMFFLSIGMNASAQYCTPYAGVNGCQYGDYISNVVMGSINNPTGCSGSAYGDFSSSMSTTVDLESTNTISVTLNPDFSQGIGVWIDWNQNMDFNDPGEFFSNGNITYPNATEVITIQTPTGATPGVTRMRVGCRYNNPMAATGSCVSGSNYGEFEDYEVNVRNRLSYSDSITAAGGANVLNIMDFSTCQTTASVVADCNMFDGNNWIPASYDLYVNSVFITTLNGNQTVDLTPYLPMSSVTLDPIDNVGLVSMMGEVIIISESSNTPIMPLGSNATYCKNENAVPLDATLTGTGTMLKWYTSVDGYGYETMNPTPSTTTAGTFSYWVSQAEINGCESPRRKIDVLVHDLPDAPIASNQSFCSDALVDQLVPAPSANYHWYDSPGSSTELTSGTFVDAGDYYVSETDANGCESPRTTVTISFNENGSTVSYADCSPYYWSDGDMTLNSTGTYYVVLTNINGCDSTVVMNFTLNTATSGSEDVSVCDSYQWSADGVTYTTSGSYTAVLTNSVGCDSIVTLNLTINASPSATATDNGDGTLTATAGASYQWYDCATTTAISGATSQTFAPSANGNYAVEVTNASGCSDMSACTLIDYLSIDQASLLQVEVFPNPTTGTFTVSMSFGKAHFVLTDANGAVVQKGSLSSGSTIDVSAYENGVYFLNIVHENGSAVKRIVKQ